MLEKINLQKTLFIDIETVPQYASFDELDENMAELWKYKTKQLLKHQEEETLNTVAANYYERAGIYAEYGKIICISVGILYIEDEVLHLKLKSFAGDNEQILLEEFLALINRYYRNPEKCFLCGHNIKEFDIPYICRRILINKLKLPKIFNLYGKKPWETTFLIDTLELWRFGDYKSYTSLKLLTAILDIPSSKEDIDGSQVAKVYYEEQNLDRIVNYCQRDVVAVVQLFLRYSEKELIDEAQIIVAD
jgi:3'-5' exonuclease